MKVALLNVRYSPNLGDGLLAECLEHTLIRFDPAIQVRAVDLAGRTAYGEENRYRRLLLTLLQGLPAGVRHAVSRFALSQLGRLKLRSAFRAALADCDAVVIGGGNLFADADLNFPTKIELALTEAARGDLPVAVFAVGVSDNWSGAGERLFARGLKAVRLVLAAVRDDRSRRIWDRRLTPHAVMTATIARDPGLLAARCYPQPAAARSERSIAFGITDPLAVRYHGGRHGGDQALTDWYGAAVAALAAAGWQVRLFTNGSPEDRDFLARHGQRWIERAQGQATIVPAFDRPADLVAAIADARLVVAHRMHACIAAYSCGVPPIGLRWDPKLDSFFAMTSREGFMVDTMATDAATLVALADQAVAEGIEPGRRSALLNEASDSVGELSRRLRDAVHPAA